MKENIKLFFRSDLEYLNYLKSKMNDLEKILYNDSLKNNFNDYNFITSVAYDPNNPNPVWDSIKTGIEYRLYGLEVTSDDVDIVPF